MKESLIDLSEPAARGFNGQSKRKALVASILDALDIHVCVETGTYRGATTAWLALHGQTVFTVELNEENRVDLERMFSDIDEVSLHFGDSRRFLKELSAEPRCPQQGVCFYLDAHWNQDLPLREEVRMVATGWRRSVIMIDDFEVPNDSGYYFDSYAGVGTLTRTFLEGQGMPRFHWFWPSTPSRNEDGACRGCAVLAWEDDVAEILARLPTLHT